MKKFSFIFTVVTEAATRDTSTIACSTAFCTIFTYRWNAVSILSSAGQY